MTAFPTLRPRMHATRVFPIVIMLLGAPPPAASQSRDSVVSRVVPVGDSIPACCTIVRIDAGRRLITARELATGFTFRFQRKDRRAIGNVKLGQPVWADFTGKTVALNAGPDAPCCVIVPPDTP